MLRRDPRGVEGVQGLCSSDQLPILVGKVGGLAGLQPVAERLLGGRVSLLRRLELQRRLFIGVRGIFLGALGLIDRQPQRLRRRLIEEVIPLGLVFDVGQVVDHDAAETDEAEGEHHCHDPEAPVEPPLGQSKRPTHAADFLWLWSTRLRH